MRILLVYLLLFFPFSLNATEVMFGNTNLECGNFDQFSTVGDSDDLSVTAAAAMGTGSNYGLAVVNDDAVTSYGKKTWLQQPNSSYTVRVYIDPNGLTSPVNKDFYFAVFRDGGYGRVFLRLRTLAAGGHQISAFSRNDAGAYQPMSWHSVTDAPHYVEFVLQYASSAIASDAVHSLYIDGVLKQQLTGIDTYDLTGTDQVILGAAQAVDVATSGTFYVDEAVIHTGTSLIGPVILSGKQAITN